MDKVCISERRDNGRRGRPGSYRKWPWADAPCLRRNESAKETIQIKNIHRYNIDINIIRIFISSRTNCFQWRQRKRGANLWRCCGCKLSLVDILGRIIHHAHEKQTRRDDATSWGGWKSSWISSSFACSLAISLRRSEETNGERSWTKRCSLKQKTGMIVISRVRTQ